MLKRFLLVFAFCCPLTCYAVDVPKAVFIKATSCTDTIPAAAVSSFREEIRGSNGYRLASSLTDDGGLGVVLTIYLNCAQDGEGRSGIASIATIYGGGRCVLGSCHVNSYESTLQSLICGGNVAKDCGKEMFTAFDNFWSGPNAPPLDLK
jgi:hypothetical protein